MCVYIFVAGIQNFQGQARKVCHFQHGKSWFISKA